MNKTRLILSSKLNEVRPSVVELEKIKKETDEVIEKLENAVKSMKIKAEVFLGGSLAKGTIIKKERYDIDIFVRFFKDEEISEKLEKILKKAGLKGERIHGSRDYFKLMRKNLFEIIPTLKIKKPEEAKNVTDLSYFHVFYVLGKIKKNKKLADEIMLAKSFCYSQRSYGAESYVKGFSGYALELLICYYNSLLNFIKAVAKAKEQIVLDPGKHYKNRQEVLLNLNEAKLQSPIVFVDPTFKERNALAALSKETFSRFQETCRKFLKNPSRKFFEMQKVDEKKFNFILEAGTNRQEGDVAGSKLLKFFNFISREIEKYFKIENKYFEYDLKKKAGYYFKIKKKKEIILSGPMINKIENLIAFKNKHKDVFIRQGKAYAREKISMTIDNFMKKLDRRVMKDMGISEIRIIKK